MPARRKADGKAVCIDLLGGAPLSNFRLAETSVYSNSLRTFSTQATYVT